MLRLLLIVLGLFIAGCTTVKKSQNTAHIVKLPQGDYQELVQRAEKGDSIVAKLTEVEERLNSVLTELNEAQSEVVESKKNKELNLDNDALRVKIHQLEAQIKALQDIIGPQAKVSPPSGFDQQRPLE